MVTDVIGKLESILGHVGDENEIRALIGDVFLDREITVATKSEDEAEIVEQTMSAEQHLQNKLVDAIETMNAAMEEDVLDFSVDIDSTEF